MKPLSLTLLMNLLHLSNSVVLVTRDASLNLLLLMVLPFASIVLLMYLTLLLLLTTISLFPACIGLLLLKHCLILLCW